MIHLNSATGVYFYGTEILRCKILIVARKVRGAAFITPFTSDSPDKERELYRSESVVDTLHVSVSQTHGFIGKARKRRRIDRREASGSKRREEDGPNTPWRDIADAAHCKTDGRTDTRAMAGAVAMASAQPWLPPWKSELGPKAKELGKQRARPRRSEGGRKRGRQTVEGRPSRSTLPIRLL